MYLSITFLLLNKKNINKAYIVFLILTVFFNSLSARPYLHYMMVIIPLFVYPFMEGFDYLKNKPKLKTIFLILICAFLIIPLSRRTYDKIYVSFENNGYSDKSILEIKKLIEDNTTSDECITVYGNKNMYYVLSNRLPCSKYTYLFPIITIDKKIWGGFYSDLEKNKPKIIIYEDTYYTPYLDVYLTGNSYKLLYKSHDDYVYIREE